MNAALVVTNSFHATVFSLIFRVPFYTIRHSSRNERMVDLLKMCGLDNRLLMDRVDVERAANITDPVIDWDHVKKLLSPEIDKSRKYLAESLADIAG